VSDEEAMLLTGTSDHHAAAAALLQYDRAVFAMTLGKEGTLLGMGGRLVEVPSIPVNAVDATGAGDAFVGAVLYQLAEHPDLHNAISDRESWIRMVENANRAGARTCTYHGAMEAFAQLSRNIFN
jgi:fructokinase